MKELKKDLLAAGVSMPFGKQLHIADLNLLACQNGIPTMIKKQKNLPGWEGKPKGILQILYERGLIAESNYQSMTLDGQKIH